MIIDLDDRSLYEQDRFGMLRAIETLGLELDRAWHRSEDIEIPAAAADARTVVIAGMGGSATAGDYFAALCADAAEIPVHVVRGYSLPNYVSERTLVVVSSYSGNTEETLAAYDDAWKRGASIFVITTGGKLAQRAREDGVPVHTITYESSPRAAIAHGLAPLLRLGASLDLCAAAGELVRAAADAHERFVVTRAGRDVPTASNQAKQVAEALQGRVPFVLGAEHLATVASRFKNQLAENGKVLGAADVLPEADHNLIVGLETAPAIANSLALVTLESAAYDERTRRRFDVTCDLFAEAGVPVHRLAVEGHSLLDQLMVGTAWGDFISVYLGLIQGVDPTPVPQIDRLKAALAG